MNPEITVLGCGFIGFNLVTSYINKNIDVRVLDCKPCPPEFAKNIEWVQGSFLNKEHIRKAIRGVNVVFHLISTTVPGDRIDEGEELSVNVIKTIELLKLCLEEQIKRVVFISSASVYGYQDHIPISETAATNPISSHGIQKLTIEKFLQLFKYEYGLDYKIMRLSNPYGIGQNIYGRQGFIAISLGRILAGKAIQVRGDGSTIRDYIYIGDVVDACQKLASTSSMENIFNIGSGRGSSLMGIIGEMELILGKKISVEHVPGRNVDIPVSVLDISCARSELNFEPSVGLSEGLRNTMIYHGLL
ncbi:MAG: NAD-dependent epimerase/dehydratase family protein [Alphaproteobacteria bacterium]|nr:NAD-dependent epimerase/dehydratase family protein [Alphaproteobacteria bacterium]